MSDSSNTQGFIGSLTSTMENAYNKVKSMVSSQPSYGAPQQQQGTSYGSTGGKRRRKSRRMRGGNFTDNTSRSGLASTAAPISGIRSAQPHSLVGGRTRRRSCNCSCKNKHSKSCRSRKR